MNISIATAPCSWGVFFPDGRTSGTPYETFLAQASEAGYKQIELGPDGYLPQDAGLLREKLGQFGLSVCAGTATIPFGTMSQEQCRGMVDALAKRLASLGCSDMVVMDGSAGTAGLGDKASWTEEAWDGIYARIADVDRYLRDSYGVRVVFHPHAGTAIETTGEILRMLDTGGIALCFDTGHHIFVNGGTERGDQSALQFIRQHSGRIAYLHFKNVDGAVRRKALEEGWTVMQAFMNQAMCDLEDGVLDFEQLRDTLEQIGYEGTAVIEQDMFKATGDFAFRTAKKNLQYLQRIHMIP